jgi:hypothetical protein
MAKQISCGICAIYGETVAMVLVNSFFRCPECNAELHVNDSGDDTFIRSWQRQQQYVSMSLQEGEHPHGGNDPTGKSPKDRMRKKSISETNLNLYK